MIKQKILTLGADAVDKTIQPLLDDGWQIEDMVAETVSRGGGMNGESNGKIIFYLTKDTIGNQRIVEK